MTEESTSAMPVKHVVYEALEAPECHKRPRVIIDLLLAVLILLNCVLVGIESIPQLAERHKTAIKLFEIFSVIIFAIEYATRLWVVNERPEETYRDPVLGRLRFMLNPLAIIDLLAIVSFFFFDFDGMSLRFLRIFRLFRILNFFQYTPSIMALRAVMIKEWRNLMASLLVMLIMLYISAVLVYFLEREAQPEKFSSIFESMWWAISALTTVGFGDVVPITAAGRIVGGIVMVVGVVMFAVPTGILASAFVEELRGRSFLAAWKLVAQVPFFHNFHALQIAEIAEKLKTKAVMPGEVLFTKGEKAHCMYFIVSGLVEIRVRGRVIQLADGEFFGEMALLYGTRRSADVRALTYGELLALEHRDFHAILSKHDELRKMIEEEAGKRMQERNAAD